MRCVLVVVLLTFCTPTPVWGQVIGEDFKLLAKDAAAGDQLGFSMGIDSGIVVVGANADDDNGSLSGSVYTYDAATGAQLLKITPSDGAGGDQFGYSLAVDNGLIVVGAFQDNDNGPTSGSAYIFDLITGAQITKLLASDGLPDDQFGYSVAINNGVVVVGARGRDDNGDTTGAAYVFDAMSGTQTVKLLANDGVAGDNFGWAVGISNGVVAVGAPLDDDLGQSSGSVYTFDATTGAQTAKLLANDGAFADYFGVSLGMDANTIIIGAMWNDDQGQGSGSAYLFDATAGSQLYKLLPEDGAGSDGFGWSSAISNGVAIVASREDDDNGSNSGSAYLFDVATGNQITKLLPSDGSIDDQLGWSVAIDNDVAGTGVILSDDGGDSAGSAYLFSVPGAGTCAADLTGDGLLNFFDVSAFLSAFSAGDPSADFTGDGLFNFFDVSDFLSAFAAGCP